MFNHRHLKTFVTIADYGSFAVAADRLGLTQSAVSMQIKTLEDDLGGPLFDRATRSPKLNSLGYAMLDNAKKIIALSDEMRQIATGSPDLVGTLRLGVISSVSTGALPFAISQLSEKHPNFKIKIENGYSDNLIQAVRNNTIDAAVVTEPIPSGGDLKYRTIVEEPLLIVAPRGTDVSTSKRALEKLPFVRFNRTTGTGRLIQSHLNHMNIHVQEMMELDSIEAILEMVAEGIGAAVVPEHCVTVRYIDKLEISSFGNPAVIRKVGFVERPNQPRSTYTDALYEELVLSEKDRERPLSQALKTRIHK